MAKGTNRAHYLVSAGHVGTGAGQSPYDYLYEHSTTRNPLHQVGDRVVLPDGRVFRYAKASGTMQCDYAAKFCNNEFIEYVAVAAAQAVGDREVNQPVYEFHRGLLTPARVGEGS